MVKFKRSRKKRESRRIFLIITEGNIDEIYFKQYRKHRNNSESKVSINVKTAGHATDPYNIIKYAVKEKNKIKDNSNALGGIFCVFDIDIVVKTKEKTVKENLSKAENLGKRNNISLITSFPCFELWLLLYFEDYNKPGFECETVIKELQKFLSSYSKNKKEFDKINFFDKYSDKFGDALNRAKKLKFKNNSDNLLNYPYTKIYEIFEAIK